MRWIRETKIDFIGFRGYAYLISAIVVLAGVIAFTLRGSRNFGIDFTGGTLLQLKFTNEVSEEDIRRALVASGITASLVQKISDEHEVIIRTYSRPGGNLEEDLKSKFRANPFQILRNEDVGPMVGDEMRWLAIKAVVFSFGGIIAYVAFRFKFKYAVASVIALLHDVLVSVGAVAITGREINLPVLAALLTIIGFSINDTIVIFDRIREESKVMYRATFEEIVNTSANRCLSRTLLTSFTVFLTTLALYIFGGEVINDFSFTFLVGIITGTYSTIYVASAILIDWNAGRTR